MICLGCGSLSPQPEILSEAGRPAESREEVQSALKAVAGSLAEKEIGDKDLKTLQQQIEQDPEAQQVVESLTEGLREAPIRVKYCPWDGERYAPHLELCPIHGEPLRWVEE